MVMFVIDVLQVTLHAYEWNAQEIINKYKENANEVLVFSHVKPRLPSAHVGSSRTICAICANSPPILKYSALACGHYFCNDCWAMHFEVQIMQGHFYIYYYLNNFDSKKHYYLETYPLPSY